MFSKPLKTIRVGNLDTEVKWGELIALFTGHGFKPTAHGSLCPASSVRQVATLSFQSENEAKKALDLSGKFMGPCEIGIDREFLGLTVLAASENPLVDIIAIHGLNGHAFATWVSHQAENDSMWLRDFLPGALNPSAKGQWSVRARVMTYGYNSALLGANTSVSKIRDFAKDLLQRIVDDRFTDQEMKRPIIFICHSLGGIVVKQALVLAHQEPARYPHVFKSTHSILFLATPHGGSWAADQSKIISRIASLSFQNPATQLLEALKSNSQELVRLSLEFRELASNFDIVSFYERRKTAPLGSLVVDENSAKLGLQDERTIPMDSTHSDICKFSGPTHSLFTTVLSQIRRCSTQAPADVAARFQSNMSQNPNKRLDTRQEAENRHFFVPVVENPFFQGRTKEIAELQGQVRIPNSYSRSQSPTVIAVYGLGGVGKTQLVTEYVYRHKKLKPKSAVFWVSATSIDRINSQYHTIAQKLKSSENAKPGYVTESLKVKVSGDIDESSGETVETGNSVEESLTGVSYVFKWMMRSENKDWLLVFDNFDDIRMKIRPFIPTSAAGNVIVTTRDRRIIGSLADSGIELQGLAFAEGEELLLRLQHHNTPVKSADPRLHPEYSAIQYIVRELHGFPLALDQAAAFIRESAPMTFQEYANYLKPRSEDRELLLSFKEANPKYPESIMTTWEISMRSLEADRPQASLILTLLGFFSHSLISENVLKSATATSSWTFASYPKERTLDQNEKCCLDYLTDGAGFRVSVGILVSLSLVTRSLDYHFGPALSVHPLVHEWIRLRLKSNPQYQARLAHDAAMVLYHAFPFEVLTGNVTDSDTTISTEAISQLDRIAPHIQSLLLNLREYQDLTISAPLELTSLLAAIMLIFATTMPERKYTSNLLLQDTSSEVLEALDKSSRHKGANLRRLRLILCYVLAKLHSCNTKAKWDQAATEIGNKLQSAELKESLSSRDSVFLAVFLTSVFDFVEKFNMARWSYIQDPSILLDLQSDLRQSGGLRSDTDVVSHKHVLKLLLGLRNTISLDLKTSRFDQRVKLYFEYRLVTILPVAEYWQQSDHFLTSAISSLDISDLEFDDRGRCLSLYAKLLRERPGLKDFNQIKEVYDMLLNESRSLLESRRSILEEKREEAEMARQALHSRISSSEGRYGNSLVADLPFMGFDSLRALGFFWDSILPVIEEISDPSTCWVSDSKTQQGVKSLSLAERRYALNAFRNIVGLVNLANPERDRFFEFLEPRSLRLSLLKVFENVQEWACGSRLSYVILECSTIRSVCQSFAQKPWECAEVFPASESVFNEPRERLSPHSTTSLLSVTSAAREITGRLLMGNVAVPIKSPHYSIHDLSEWHSQIRLRSLQLIEDHDRILSRRIWGKVVVEASYADNPKKGAIVILNNIGILPACDSIFHDNTDAVIATFIKCGLNASHITPSVAERARSRLAQIQGNKEDPLVSALGRLRLLYDLICDYKGLSIVNTTRSPNRQLDSDSLRSYVQSHACHGIGGACDNNFDPEDAVIDSLSVIYECTEDHHGKEDDDYGLALTDLERDEDAEWFFDDF